jgi:cell division control protein 42
MTDRCVLLGDNGIGKTTLLTRYVTNQFCTPDCRVFDYCAVDASVDGQSYSLALWDTWNDEERNRLRRLVYPNTDVFLICFSVVNRESFSSVEYYWFDELRRCCPGVPWLLVGTQIDARDDDSSRKVKEDWRRHVTCQEGERMARKLGAAGYIECSALNHINVKELFQKAIHVSQGPMTTAKEKSTCVIV